MPREASFLRRFQAGFELSSSVVGRPGVVLFHWVAKEFCFDALKKFVSSPCVRFAIRLGRQMYLDYLSYEISSKRTERAIVFVLMP